MALTIGRRNINILMIFVMYAIYIYIYMHIAIFLYSSWLRTAAVTRATRVRVPVKKTMFLYFNLLGYAAVT